MRTLRKLPKNGVGIKKIVSILVEKVYNTRKNIKNKGAAKVSETKDFLNGKITELKTEQAAYVGDVVEQRRINGLIGDFQKELDEIEAAEVKSQEDEQAKTERIEVAKGEAADLFSDEAFKDLPPTVLEFVQLALEQAVRKEQEASEIEKSAWVEKYSDKIKLLIDQGMETENQRVDAEDKVETLKENLKVAREEIKELEEALEYEKQRNYEIALLRDDAEEKRDNAVRERDEERKEAQEQIWKYAEGIDRLNAQIAEYQAAKVFDEKESQRMIEVTATDKMRELAEKITKEYKVVAELGLYKEIADAEGNKEVVHNTELDNRIIVADFQPPHESTFHEQEVALDLFQGLPNLQQGNESQDRGEQREAVEMGEERRVENLGREEGDRRTVNDNVTEPIILNITDSEGNEMGASLVQMIQFEQKLANLDRRISALENSPIVLKEKVA